ncbi:DUF2306 domain-containing protein [Ephemeroptericola cinctiostellae]|uniref:DUF2306 domain-containing protein n=1 Tax=Ephemeroptericola cinctiostellae TaxID=2268024 RepID=UPI000DF7F5F0|nr:DUF2306 domain-containing protein [Ephemeroptericola cinctiostellae]
MFTTHLVCALLSLIVGAWQLMQAKGTPQHKTIGRFWLLCMAVTSLSSFWLHGVGYRWGWIHVLSVWTLFCLVCALYFARTKNIRRHRKFVVGAYCGLVGAGVAAVLMPGRVLNVWLFG